MKYIVVRKKKPSEITIQEGFEIDLMGAEKGIGNRDIEESLTGKDVSSEDIPSHKEAEDLMNDESVEDVFLALPLSLVKPTETDEKSEAETEQPWGIEAVKATGHTYALDDVKVAVLDTGIDTTHEAFKHIEFNKDNLMDFTTDEKGIAGSADDKSGHGTHVAGTIFGGDVEGKRIGVAPGIKNVLIGKVIGKDGVSVEGLENAIQWALRNNADIISMSLGFDYPAFSKRVEAALGLPEEVANSRALKAYRGTIRLFDKMSATIKAKAEKGKGAVIISASGNESLRRLNPTYTIDVAPPASAEDFISVGAIDKNRVVADFSNTGCRVCAPGVSIVSAALGGGLQSQSGTSMATPHVAGVTALWIHKLAQDWQRLDGKRRPPGWSQDVIAKVTAFTDTNVEGTRNDIGMGLVRAPQL